MEAPLSGSQQNEGHGKLPGEDWSRELGRAILKIGEMTQLPNFTEQLEDFEPKFKEIVRDCYVKSLMLDMRVGIDTLSGGRDEDEWEGRMREGVDALYEVLKGNIFVRGAYDHLPPRLQWFMDDLFDGLGQFKEHGGSSIWPIFFHPYLSDASTRIEFRKATYDFFYNEHPRSRKGVEPIFKRNLGLDYKNMVKGITRKVLEYRPRQVNRRPVNGQLVNQDSGETYKDAIDIGVRLPRNAHEHYKKYLPAGERELTDIEIEEMISQDFPGGYEKVYRSVKTILTIKGYLNETLREKLLNKLVRSITGNEAGGAHGQSCMRIDSTVGAQSEQITSVQIRESTAGGVSIQNGKTVHKASK